MAVFLESCGQKLEKEDDLDAFDEGDFHQTLQSLAPPEAEFYGEENSGK